MLSIFFYKGGILSAVTVPKGVYINCDFYTKKCLKPLCRKWKTLHKKPGLKNFVLHQDNTSSHFGKKAKEFYNNRSIKILKHPPYSPDLSPCDFWLFPKVKNLLKDINFGTTEEVLDAFFEIVDQFNKNDFKECFEMWIERCRKCLLNNGNYF